MQAQGIAVFLLSTSAPPTPFLAGITPLHDSHLDLCKCIRSRNQIFLGLQKRDLEMGLLEDQPQQDLLTHTHNLERTARAI